jgi:hypothetical protein
MERLVSRIVLGAITPVSLFLAGWWGTLAVLGDSALIPWAALGGLALGLALDATALRRRLGSLYIISPVSQAAVAVFYAVMIYGFFMGFPVPVLLVGLGWGFAAVRARDGDLGIRARRIRAAAFGSALLMFIACLATAWLAFREPSIASQARGMLDLPFTPSMGVLAASSAIGGLGLIALAFGIPVMFAAWGDKGHGSVGATF